MYHHVKAGLDVTSAMTVLTGAVFNWLPTIALIPPIIWYSIQIFEYLRAKFKKD